MVSKLRYPSSSTWVTITPISSMCPANISRGPPLPSSRAKEFPATSACTASANLSASARQTRAGAASNDEGPGVSSSRFRKAKESEFTRAAQRKFQVQGARHRVVTIGQNIAKTKPAVERDGHGHGGQAIEPHGSIAQGLADLNDPLYQHAPDSVRSDLRLYVQPLHLENQLVE